MVVSVELVLKAGKLRVGSEALLLEAVVSCMENNLSETRYLSYERLYSQRKDVSTTREASRQGPLLTQREGHNLSIPLLMGQKLDQK